MTGNEQKQGEKDESFFSGAVKDQHHKEEYSNPTDRRTDDHQTLGKNDGVDAEFPVPRNRKAKRGEYRGKLVLCGGKSGIKQQGTAERERCRGDITGLLLGESPVVPKLGGSLLQVDRIGEERAVARKRI